MTQSHLKSNTVQLGVQSRSQKQHQSQEIKSVLKAVKRITQVPLTKRMTELKNSSIEFCLLISTTDIEVEVTIEGKKMFCFTFISGGFIPV